MGKARLFEEGDYSEYFRQRGAINRGTANYSRKYCNQRHLFIMDLSSLGNLDPKLFSFSNMAVEY